jgi:hypothetical protein
MCRRRVGGRGRRTDELEIRILDEEIRSLNELG